MRSRSFSPSCRVALGLLLAAAAPVAAQSNPTGRRAAVAGEDANSQADADAAYTKFDLNRAVVSEGGGLTAAEAGKRARARSPRILAARAAASSAHWDAETAWAGFLPQLSAYGTYKRINKVINNVDLSSALPPALQDLIANAPATTSSNAASSAFSQPLNQISFGASLSYPVSDLFLRVWPAYKGAKGVVDAQSVQVEVAESIVDVDARTAFYDYARAIAQLAVASQAVRQAEAQAAQIKLFVNAGTVAPVDALTATARFQQARGAEARARGTLAAMQSRLATLTGMDVAEVGPIAEPVLDPPAFKQVERAELLKRALEERPELRALRKVAEANDLQRKAQRNAGLPQLVLQASGLTAQPNPRYIPPNTHDFRNSWELGGSIQWSPNNSLNGYYAGQKGEATVAKARADLATQEDAVRIEVVNAHEDLMSALAVAEAAQAQLGAAEEAYRVRSAMYRVGAGVIIDLLNADFSLTQARLDHANATIGARAALATLQRVAVLDRD